MSEHLTILISESGAKVFDAIEDWNNASLFGTVSWTTAAEPRSRAEGSFVVKVAPAARPASEIEMDFYTLLTSRFWEAVTVVGLRSRPLNEISKDYFEKESLLLEIVRGAFQNAKDVIVRGVTVGIADSHAENDAFQQNWDLHLLHEPKLYIDAQIASQPLTADHRETSVLLLAVLASGGFRWQSEPMIGELKDPAQNLNPIVRIARANVRVVNAGRLTDKVLSGAFPESGPWSQPSDVRNGVAMPMGAHLPEALIESLLKAAQFVFVPWQRPKSKGVTQVGIVQGLLLFLKHFLAFLRQAPSRIIEDFKVTIGEKVARAAQSLTYGEDSELQIAYKPNSNVSSNAVLRMIRRSGMPELDSPIADSMPWVMLRRTVLGLVDGGKLPEEIGEPLRGANRLLFLDPNCIGPPVMDRSFALQSPFVEYLNLPEDLLCIKSLDVENARLLKDRILKQREELRQVKQVETDESLSDSIEPTDGDKPSLSIEEIEEFSADFDDWLEVRKFSLLWIVCQSILAGIDEARGEMSDAFKRVPPPDIAIEEEKKAHDRARKWTIRGLIGLGFVVLTSILGVFFAIFSLFIWIGFLVSYLFGLALKCATLARDLAALQFRRQQGLREIELQLRRGQHSAKELVRLIGARDQLNEWQEILREIVHAPFGRTNSFDGSKMGISAIACPPQFVLATADPSEDQITAAMSSAKDHTIHAGWLNETFESLRKQWSDQYKKWSAAGSGDDLSPENDNVDSSAVRGKRPLTREPLYYPRSDFHRAILSGDLRSGLIQGKVDQISADLRRTPLKELLSHVMVSGLGQALSGQPVEKFLDGLQISKEDIPIFDPELFSISALALRNENIDMSLPPADKAQTHALSSSVRPGEELVAVAARIDLSTPMTLQSMAVFSNRTPVAETAMVKPEIRGPSAV